MRWRLEAELLAAGEAVAGECWSLLLGLCAEAAGVAGDAAGDAAPPSARAIPAAGPIPGDAARRGRGFRPTLMPP